MNIETDFDISYEEKINNEYFRNGDYKHVFEYGQRKIPEWRDKTELQVLIERVKQGLKPIAAWSARKTDLELIKSHNLYYHDFINDWGMHVVQFTAFPDKKIFGDMTARDYVHYNSIDLGCGLSLTECALCYGYVTPYEKKSRLRRSPRNIRK